MKDIIVVNDRWGAGTYGKHGGYYNFADKFNPGALEKHKWENAMTIDREAWGYRRNVAIKDYLTINELLIQLASTVRYSLIFLI